MREHRQEHTIARMAKVLGVSESGYFKWCKKNNAPLTEKEQEDIKITEEIFAIYRSSRGSYGSRKITAILNKMHKKPINHKRVERIMQECCLFSKSCKKYICTTDSDHDELIADNLIDRDFTAEEPDSKMLSDTTVITTGQGKLYVAGILDLYGDMPVGIAMSTRNDKKLVMDAFDDMIMRGCGKPGCIIHSDRGSTYCATEYRQLISKHDFLCSMSRKGDCWDNAPMESFWGKMKSEWLSDKYDTIQQAKRDVYEYVWHFYPKERPHETFGYLTPSFRYPSGFKISCNFLVNSLNFSSIISDILQNQLIFARVKIQRIHGKKRRQIIHLFSQQIKILHACNSNVDIAALSRISHDPRTVYNHLLCTKTPAKLRVLFYHFIRRHTMPRFLFYSAFSESLVALPEIIL